MQGVVNGSMFDIRIVGGTVIDGEGQRGALRDVGIVDGKIAAVATPGSIPLESAAETVDATGRFVTPGFIDLHNHADFTIQGCPQAPSQVAQGVTTLLLGNCGSSPFPAPNMDEVRRTWGHLDPVFTTESTEAEGFIEATAELPLEINVAFQVGFSALRRMAMGNESRAASPAEVQHMILELRKAAEAGVRGFSTGLIYAPGAYAQDEEINQVVAAAVECGLLYSTHMRDEADYVLDSVRESINAIRDTGGRLQISHIKATDLHNHGRVSQALELIDAARASGIDVAADVYPYTASSTTMTALLPTWLLDEGREAIPGRLVDADVRARAKQELADILCGRSGAETVVVASVSDAGTGGYEWTVGKNLAEIGEEDGCDPAEAALRVLEAHAAGVAIIHHSMSEDDVRSALTHPHVAVASDGNKMAATGAGRPHPRSFATFTRVLSHYVRDEGLLTIEEAVRKMTSLPASRLQLTDRGVIAEGKAADIAVFDLESLVEHSTFDDPWQLTEGVDDVIVGGRFATRNGSFVYEAGGSVL